MTASDRAAPIEISYFPGCSLATTAKENNQSLIESCARLGIRLVEIPDWNCCGSSSAHSIDHRLAFDLACRNLALAPPGRPLVTACPSCTLRLKHAQHLLRHDAEARSRYEALWGRPYDPDLHVRHFFGLMVEIDWRSRIGSGAVSPLDLTFAPYYGCMLNRPAALRPSSDHHGIMERVLGDLGMRSVLWASSNQCCGTFLTVARPDIVTPKVNAILQNAADSGAECVVTACAMCHMNLEVRCTLQAPIPIFHFSELIALAFGSARRDWFSRHLIDPRPLLSRKGLAA